MLITEERIIAEMEKFLIECDADELARLTEEFFGGKCFPAEEEVDGISTGGLVYNFEPNENYFGAFDPEN